MTRKGQLTEWQGEQNSHVLEQLAVIERQLEIAECEQPLDGDVARPRMLRALIAANRAQQHAEALRNGNA